MSNQFGFILSGPKYTLKPVEEIRRLPMREIYLENDHRAHYRVEERTKGKYLFGLTGMTASLSHNPSGSAVPLLVSTSLDHSSSFLTTQSLVTRYSSSFSASVTQSHTSSFLSIVSASLTSSWTGATTASSLTTPMPESAYASADYIGTILGSNITMALSASLSQSFTWTASGSFVTSSTSASYIPSASSTTSIDNLTIISYIEVTGSTTNSTEIPLPNKGRRIYEIVTSGSIIKVSSPMWLRSVRWMG